MLHVYQIPQQRSNGYCFGGPVPIMFGNVDWMNTPERAMAADQVITFIKSKDYFAMAPVGTRFLLLCDDRPDLTCQIVKEGGQNRHG